MGYLGLTLFLLGLILLICYSIGKRKNSRCSEQTEGKLINIVERENSDGPLSSMYVYTYYVDGIEYQLKSTAYNKHVDKIGDKCTIWYNPKKPKDAQSFHYDSNKVFRVILIIGIILLVLGIALPIVSIGLQAMSK